MRQIDPDASHVFGGAPFRAPFPLGHECVAEVLECGEQVQGFRRGDRVVVPFQISCGSCMTCATNLTAHCQSVPAFSMYGGVGGKNDGWGGALSDCVRVPYGDAMLVRVPDGVDAAAVASASDNLPDAWRTVAPALAEKAGARVLVAGGAIKSIGLYAAADATNDARGLNFAMRATAAGGVCTTVGIFPRKATGIPMMRMYSHGLTLKNGVTNARPAIPAILELVRDGRLKPEIVTTSRANWNDAADAFMANSTKVVVTRDTIC